MDAAKFPNKITGFAVILQNEGLSTNASIVDLNIHHI